jgi:Sarcosine oxidase gamma subunit
MVERESPLGAAFRPGRHGNLSAGPGLRISEVTPSGIAEAAAWPGMKAALAEVISSVTALSLSAEPNTGDVGPESSAFSIGPQRFLVTGGADLPARLAAALPLEIGTVTDLSHGRTAIRIEGARAGWVLSKLFAIDFHAEAFPLTEGRATVHHDIFAQIQRISPDGFDIYVFRSFARAFWLELCEAAEEVGYEVAG